VRRAAALPCLVMRPASAKKQGRSLEFDSSAERRDPTVTARLRGERLRCAA
jgi:hypothetical protein